MKNQITISKENGKYRVVFPAGTVIEAKTREQLKEMIKIADRLGYEIVEVNK